ncbi:ethylbenzene dehydrogenase-related protein [Thiohalomonas denitrificans]|uniref:ethylbenzene dehydrogenase-related protein n=1 Tax=Thiohalomonas denitrificans TaxID=415747 RepID=UPI0026F2589E|nr:ethylbenzene dehydrogenase-related protein [Thiohalomonas denitrificans]
MRLHSSLQRSRGVSTGIITAVMGAALLYGCAESPREGAGAQMLRETNRLSDVVQQSVWPWRLDRWEGMAATVLILHPQRMILPRLDKGAPVEARLWAQMDGGQLLLRIDWPDTSEDRYSTAHTERFADALAVQFVADDGERLPYIGMGEPERPVHLWFWRAGRETEALTAHGFGTLEPDIANPAPEAVVQRTAEGWSLLLSGPLPVQANPLAVSLAVGDGAEAGRDGRKRLSSWHLLRLPARPVDQARLATLAGAAGSDGDIERGRRLVQERGCTACHRLPGSPSGDQGPDLTLAGGMHWPGYLRRSIAEPNAFIVPDDRYRTPEAGSLMPALNLPESEVEDITAYLSSLR